MYYLTSFCVLKKSIGDAVEFKADCKFGVRIILSPASGVDCFSTSTLTCTAETLRTRGEALIDGPFVAGIRGQMSLTLHNGS